VSDDWTGGVVAVELTSACGLRLTLGAVAANWTAFACPICGREWEARRVMDADTRVFAAARGRIGRVTAGGEG
jgi:predicted RNA-binding Zn-ribbon protein involved in translation (DUF1610 family)